ncbi:MAG: hypothetical protein ACOYOH_12675 [Paracraurococcus sp.]
MVTISADEFRTATAVTAEAQAAALRQQVAAAEAAQRELARWRRGGRLARAWRAWNNGRA